MELLDYNFLKIMWWMIIGCILVIYGGTAGFDFSVTMIMPLLKNKMHYRILLNTSAPSYGIGI